MAKSIRIVKVLVVDDHPLFREAIVALLLKVDHTLLVHEAENGEQALQLLADGTYQLVCLDLDMPVLNGKETFTSIMKLGLKVSVVIVSAHAERSQLLAFYGKGIRGYILKDSSAKELIRALSILVEGGEYYTPHLLQQLLKKKGPGKLGNALSEQEKNVLALLCEEMSNEEIAKTLCLSPHTIRRHRQNIKEKIGAKNMVGFVWHAIKEGVLSNPRE